MAIRAITFDFWCTLFRDAHSAERQQIRIRAFSEAAAVSENDAARALAQTSKEFYRSHVEDQRTLGPEDAVRLAAASLGVTLGEDVQRDLAEIFGAAILRHSPLPIQGAIEAVQAAAQRGPVGILSDSGLSPGRSLRGLLERHGLLDLFQALVFSDEVGVAKPQPLMFQTIAQGLGVAPSELLHIGDLETTDIVGAKALGATAALFTAENDRYLEATTADYTFQSWAEFIERLPSLC